MAEDEKTYGVVADFPHEFHQFSEIIDVERFAQSMITEEEGGGTQWIS
ncbi:MAG: hypothetical protein JW715_07395 [Sedimentisphaerales bacterium]|nr:hypothetical protein [Sedimentisphaerales bacterium]